MAKQVKVLAAFDPVQSPGPIYWKEKINSCTLSSDHYTCTVVHRNTHTHTHTQTHTHTHTHTHTETERDRETENVKVDSFIKR